MRAIDEIFDVHDGQGKPLERSGSLQLRVEVRAIIVERGVLRSAETKDGKREDVRVFVTAEKLVADAQLVAIGLLGIIIYRQPHRSCAPEAAAEVVLGVTSKVGRPTVAVDKRADRRRRGSDDALHVAVGVNVSNAREAPEAEDNARTTGTRAFHRSADQDRRRYRHRR